MITKENNGNGNSHFKEKGIEIEGEDVILLCLFVCFLILKTNQSA